MRRYEAALLVLIVLLIAWVLISVTEPLAGLFILTAMFLVFLGFFIFMVAGIVYLKRKQ